ncbi:catalase family peroxidase [Chelatococcus reniformis]|uniref:Catalase-related peroxidase n=1 Tax=Chelatococcus reniformis TaxID=1494448 RepID=A0A916X7L7_9HYPH|nr:catalase family peroxidase [Chelatococcus reniformis]GGC45983.1 sulfur regulated plasmid-encoded protein [Chelatococcus reniformis]
MPDSSQPSTQPSIGALALIAVIVAAGAGAFAYTAGWLSPGRLTPARLVNSLAPPGGAVPGHRRNHAKGICFTGVFESNGNGAEFSRAQVFARGRYAALGRFNLGSPDPVAPDAAVRVRGMGLQLSTPDGAVWRTAMIDPPIFAVATPAAFYELQTASHSPDPDAIKRFVAGHPEFMAFADWAKHAPWTASYAQDAFNGLNAFIVVDASDAPRAVRWSLRPQAPVVAVTPDALAKLGPNHLEQEIAARVAQGPQRWTMVLTLADPGDLTADPSKAWPAGRRSVDVGTLVVEQIEAERDGPCRDINFDPTILPDGIRLSDDPFPAARSAAYARSYDLRTAETKHYPYHEQPTAGGRQ